MDTKAVEILSEYKNTLQNAPALEKAGEFETLTKNFLEERGLKLKDLAQAIRIAMVGNSVSPSIFEVLEIIGFVHVIERIEALIIYKKGV